MAERNFLAGIRREIHHVKKAGDDEGYEPAMFIMRERIKGKSFIIPLSAFWKYVDPQLNADVFQEDARDFVAMAQKIRWRASLQLAPQARANVEQDLGCLVFAEVFSRGTGIMLTVAFNLAKCMQMMDINPKGHLPQAAAQLLMWIQDGLEDLKNFHEPPPEKRYSAGELLLYDGSRKIATKEITVSETELYEETHE